MFLGLNKPAKTFLVSETGALTIQASAESLRYYTLLLLGITIFNFGILWICTIVIPPTTIAQYAAWIFLGVVSLLSAVAFIVLMFGNKHTFDRNTDRFLRRQNVVSRITDILHLRLHKEHIEGISVCSLSVVFRSRKPYVLGQQRLPGTELIEVAHRIAAYSNLKVINET